MYLPRINQMADRAEAITFMRRFSFATIVTVKEGRPVATHLPFVIADDREQVRLCSHFAKANEQWKDLPEATALVIFSEPHAYISPKHYDKELNVPTWNYLSVHAYGQCRLITEAEAVTALLEQTIDSYEASYRDQWEGLPEEYKRKMANGIVAFEVTVTELQGKKKLSQNRSAGEQERIAGALAQSEDTNERLIADYMRKSRQVPEQTGSVEPTPQR